MKERMHTGELYLPGDGEIIKEQFRDIDLLKNIIKLRPGSRKSVKNCLKNAWRCGRKLLYRGTILR